MAEIVPQAVGLRKVALTMGQAAAGDEAQVGTNLFLVVRNGDAASHTVTIAVPGTGFTGTAHPDLVETVEAGELAIIPLSPVFADPTIGGRAAISYDATPATLTRGVFAKV